MTLNKYVFASAMAVTATALTVASASATTSTIPTHKIGICHATGSATNPYVFIIVDKHAVPAHTNHQDLRDIIGVTSAVACPHVVASPTPTPTPSATPSPKPSTKPTPTPTPGGSVLSDETGGSGSATVPTALPVTGATDLGLLVGLSAAAAATAGYVQHRRRNR